MSKFLATLSGVTLDVQSLHWPFTPGPISPEVKFVVNNTVADKLIQLSSNQDGELVLHADPDGDTDLLGFFLHTGLWYGEHRQVSPYEVEFTLFDSRRYYENLRITATFNRTRGTGLVSGEKRNRFFAADYMLFSLRSATEFSFASLRGGDASDQGGAEPWTAHDALFWLMNKRRSLLRPEELPERQSNIGSMRDNGRVLQNVVFKGEKFSTVLATLLSLAELSVFMNENDEWEFYDPFEPAYAAGVPLPGGYDGAGLLSNVQTANVIPKAVVVMFPKQFEFQLEYEESSSTTGARSNIVDKLQTLENVLQLPDDINDPESGLLKAGTWVTVQKAMTLWAGSWQSGLQITFDDLPELAHSIVGIADAVLQPGSNQADPENAARAAAIKKHYRKTFRIPPILLDQIDTWDTHRVAFADVVTGQKVASPVWQDYSVVYMAKTNFKLLNVPFGANVPHPSSITGGTAAPALLRIEDRARGVFSVRFNNDPDIRCMEIVHSTVDNPPMLDLRDKAQEGVTDATRFTTDFKLTTVISVSLLTPNGPDNMLAVLHNTTSDDFGAEVQGSIDGPAYEVVERGTPARYEWVNGETSLELRPGGFSIVRAVLVNEDVVTSLARAKIAQILPTFAPRPAGLVTGVGYERQRDRLRGTKASVTVKFSAEVGLHTATFFADTPPVRDVYGALPPTVRRIVYREIERS